MKKLIKSLAHIAIITATATLGTQTVLAAEPAQKQVTLTDVAGHDVTVNVPVKYMILGEGRFLPSIGILDPENPVRWIAGMMGEFKRLDPASYAQYQAKFPAIDDIALIGSSGEESFNLEKAISLHPDVAVFGITGGHGPSAENKQIFDTLAAANIPVVAIDFRQDPLVNTPKSVRILGTLMGKEDQAEKFLEFYDQGLATVHDRLATTTERPSVFMESRVGLAQECCEAMGQQMMGRFIDWAGGKNVFGDIIPGTHGTVTIEQLLVTQPDYYIATAIGAANVKDNGNRVILGAMATPDDAAKSLQHITGRTGMAQLSAIQNDHLFSIWHHFYNTPMNVAAVQQMAKWFHPDLFADLDPNQTLQTYFNQFQAVDLNGVYWTDTKAGTTPQ
ncbi:ABC transporter substrate-binding protein [Thalassospira marina]|uniref:Fe3+-hydroxamate ABC transporter substrate-binding protein n=1 Tax=Thalassospira marina TaxID=2048283 RepID=A0A2N3KXA9_9PROT|nr:ABC transporter substrate-binding protein [Thalassospira marina]PKR55215.1 Fe3+-hydroxamate ABC transporter substrate-binding protein [Thalassospira marina]